MDGWVHKLMDGWMDGWMDGRMDADKRMDGWMDADKWMDSQTSDQRSKVIR